MSLGWKDIVATVLVAGAGVITFAKIKGYSWPLLGSWRTGTLLLLALGLGTCIIIGSGNVPAKNTWNAIATGLGVLAFVLTVLGLIFNSRLLFISLAVDIVVLWFLSTIHHLATN